MTASALPLDEEEAVLTHDLELVVDPHADDKFRPSWAPRGPRRETCCTASRTRWPCRTPCRHPRCSPSSSWRAHQAGRPRSASSPSPSQPWKEAILLDRRPVEFPLPEERGPRLACLHVVSVSALDRLVIISLTEALQKYPFNKEANDYLSYLTVKSPRRPKLKRGFEELP